MRIFSGSFRGKKITAPSNLPVRPTTDFAKEGLFNILNNQFYFDEISVLDLFSGIGSISLEFLSRGSKRVVSVDAEQKCVKFLEETTNQLNVKDSISIYLNDVVKFLKRNNQGKFDVVFADPPFEFEPEQYREIVQLVLENEWLEENGVLVLEHSSRLSFDDHEKLVQNRKYGNVSFSFFGN